MEYKYSVAAHNTLLHVCSERNSIYIFTYVFIDYEHRNKNHSFPPMSAIIGVLEFFRYNFYKINRRHHQGLWLNYSIGVGWISFEGKPFVYHCDCMRIENFNVYLVSWRGFKSPKNFPIVTPSFGDGRVKIACSLSLSPLPATTN